MPVRTLLMPATGKIFLGRMMVGLMVEMVQIVLYGYVASLHDVATITDATTSFWFGWFDFFRGTAPYIGR